MLPGKSKQQAIVAKNRCSTALINKVASIVVRIIWPAFFTVQAQPSDGYSDL